MVVQFDIDPNPRHCESLAISCFLDIEVGIPLCSKPCRSHEIGRFHRFSNLIIDTRTDKLHRMSTVVTSNLELGLRERVLRQLQDLHRRLWAVYADHDRISVVRARVPQGIEPHAVAEKDFEAIASRCWR